jgi:hypothetical protein
VHEHVPAPPAQPLLHDVTALTDALPKYGAAAGAAELAGAAAGAALELVSIASTTSAARIPRSVSVFIFAALPGADSRRGPREHSRRCSSRNKIRRG